MKRREFILGCLGAAPLFLQKPKNPQSEAGVEPDRMSCRWRAAQLIAVVAGPAMGKAELTLNACAYAAAAGKKVMGIFSPPMRKAPPLIRVRCSEVDQDGLMLCADTPGPRRLAEGDQAAQAAGHGQASP